MNARKQLYQAIEKLVREKPLDKISVQEILNEAEVSRRTFYTYFSDKYDLANSFYEHHVTNELLPRYNGHNWAEVLTDLLNYIYDNIAYFQQLKKYEGQGSFFEFLTQYSFDCYAGFYKKNHGLKKLSPAQEYDIWFVTGGNIKVLEKWMESRCAMPIGELVDDLMAHTPREYYEADDSCGEDPGRAE